jgi:chemotaxis protein methyltransferase CheR
MPVQLEAADALSDRDLRTLARLIYDRAGITLHDGKKALVTARLQKRVRTGGFGSFAEYVKFIESDRSGDEVVLLLDAIATNHTSFFREPQHFEFLTQTILPSLKTPGRRGLNVWSAACSSGEEPYTIGMALADVVPPEELAHVRILASDLSTKVLRAAREGVYKMDRVEGLPRELLRRHFEKGMGAQDGLCRVSARIRQLVEFDRLNLLEIADLGRRFDVIFCRNVMIYFDRAVQQKVVSMLERHLAPNGWLLISHSESLNGIQHGLQWSAPAVYRRSGA